VKSLAECSNKHPVGSQLDATYVVQLTKSLERSSRTGTILAAPSATTSARYGAPPRYPREVQRTQLMPQWTLAHQHRLSCSNRPAGAPANLALVKLRWGYHTACDLLFGRMSICPTHGVRPLESTRRTACGNMCKSLSAPFDLGTGAEWLH
jgi:hypothetical protein